MVEGFRAKIEELFRFINIDSMGYENVLMAVRECTGDFEDDVHFAFAYNTGCDVVLTGDKDFRSRCGKKNPNIQFFTPQEFVDKLTS
jgi:predicted nucleic acid-binding protein